MLLLPLTVVKRPVNGRMSLLPSFSKLCIGAGFCLEPSPDAGEHASSFETTFEDLFQYKYLCRPGLEVKNADEGEMGLYTTVELYKGSFIGVYTGSVVRGSDEGKLFIHLNKKYAIGLGEEDSYIDKKDPLKNKLAIRNSGGPGKEKDDPSNPKRKSSRTTCLDAQKRMKALIDETKKVHAALLPLGSDCKVDYKRYPLAMANEASGPNSDYNAVLRPLDIGDANSKFRGSEYDHCYALYATKTIQPQEQILWHYGTDYDRDYSINECQASSSGDVLSFESIEILKNSFLNNENRESVETWFSGLKDKLRVGKDNLFQVLTVTKEMLLLASKNAEKAAAEKKS